MAVYDLEGIWLSMVFHVINFSQISNFRASTMETLNLEVLKGSHMDTSFFYNFLTIVLNRYSTTPIEIL